jgi:hypothetical protein
MGSTAESSLSPKLFVALLYTASIELLTKGGQGGRIPDPSLTPERGGHMVLRKDKVEIGNSGYNASVLEVKKEISDKVFARAKSASLADASRGRQGHR